MAHMFNESGDGISTEEIAYSLIKNSEISRVTVTYSKIQRFNRAHHAIEHSVRTTISFDEFTEATTPNFQPIANYKGESQQYIAR